MKQTTNSKHIISGVEKGSIADELGIRPGDALIAINDCPIRDVFDYKTELLNALITIDIENYRGQKNVFKIRKDEEEDIGLEFTQFLMDQPRSCANRCVFCFVDQLPKSLRETLYFKDDDLRLSFLTGNYVSLTNLTDEELDRLIGFRLSPMNISVHTTDPQLRERMMRNKQAGNIMDRLHRIASARIDINAQIVVCPGFNDGIQLERSLEDLSALGDCLQSIALVPVGLTKHRRSNDLEELLPVDQAVATDVLNIAKKFQRLFLARYHHRIVFAADEWYIKAGKPVPSARHYEDFPQLENGVGMIALFKDQMDKGIRKRQNKVGKIGNSLSCNERGQVIVLTGVDAYGYIQRYEASLSAIYGRPFVVKAVRNHFFGETITVTGLVTGSDIILALSGDDVLAQTEAVVVPRSMLRSGEDVFLDDLSTALLQEKLGRTLYCVSANAEEFLAELDRIFGMTCARVNARKREDRL